MPRSRRYSCPEDKVSREDEYLLPYSNTRPTRVSTYPSYAPTQATRSSNAYEYDFSSSDHTLVDERLPPLESRTRRSGSIINYRDPVEPTSLSRRRTGSMSNDGTPASPIEDSYSSSSTRRRKKTRKPKDMVYIDKLTISANGPPLETHLRNTKGNVHIKHLRIEDETSASAAQSSHRRSGRRRSSSHSKQAEKVSEGVSKLTQVCELATVAALVLQWKEYRADKKERDKERVKS